MWEAGCPALQMNFSLGSQKSPVEREDGYPRFVDEKTVELRGREGESLAQSHTAMRGFAGTGPGSEQLSMAAP